MHIASGSRAISPVCSFTRPSVPPRNSALLNGCAKLLVHIELARIWLRLYFPLADRMHNQILCLVLL